MPKASGPRQKVSLLSARDLALDKASGPRQSTRSSSEEEEEGGARRYRPLNPSAVTDSVGRTRERERHVRERMRKSLEGDAGAALYIWFAGF